MIRAGESWWQHTRVDESAWLLINLYEICRKRMKIDDTIRDLMKSARELMRARECWWNSTKFSENVWRLIKLCEIWWGAHESWWERAKDDARVWVLMCHIPWIFMRFTHAHYVASCHVLADMLIKLCWVLGDSASILIYKLPVHYTNKFPIIDEQVVVSFMM